MELKAKTVAIIGGSSGIGFATAQAAALAGAQTIVASSSPERVEAAVAKLPDGARGLVVNATSEQSIAALLETIGELDHLVYTAGEPLGPAPLGSLALARERTFFETRYWGALAAAKHAAPRLRPGGSIVLTSGGAATRPAPQLAVVASVGGAVEALTRALAVELAPIRVNAVSPGFLRTEMWNPLSESEREELYATAARAALTGRVGEAEEVAHANLYLMQNEFVTGTVLSVDGGRALT